MSVVDRADRAERLRRTGGGTGADRSGTGGGSGGTRRGTGAPGMDPVEVQRRSGGRRFWRFGWWFRRRLGVEMCARARPGPQASAGFDNSSTLASVTDAGLVSGGQSRAIVGARVYVLETDASTTGKSSTSLLTSARVIQPIPSATLLSPANTAGFRCRRLQLLSRPIRLRLCTRRQ